MLRSISVHKNGSFVDGVDDIIEAMPRIKDIGFNAIWLVLPWAEFCPRPLRDEDNEDTFSELIRLLEACRGYGLQAMLPLNYFGEGWEPEGINARTFLTDMEGYSSFERYVSRFLRRIQGFSDMVYILCFSEGMYAGRDPRAEGDAISYELQETLGSLPRRMPDDLRAAFKFGYHDGEFLAMGYGGEYSPVQTPCPYDFLSMVGYVSTMNDKSVKGIRRELDIRKSRFKEKHFETPIYMGEWGASSCPERERYQANKNQIVLDWAEGNLEGWSLWGWFPGPQDQDCTNPVFNGLSITRYDGSYKQTAKRIKRRLHPSENGAEQEDDRSWFEKLIDLIFGWLT